MTADAIKLYKRILDGMKRQRGRGIEHRLDKLERRVAGLIVRTNTLYHAAYARAFRREAATIKTMDEAKRLVGVMRRTGKVAGKIGKLVGSLSRKRMVVTLPLVKFHRLHYMLRPAKTTKGPSGTRPVFLSKKGAESLRVMLNAVRMRATRSYGPQ